MALLTELSDPFSAVVKTPVASGGAGWYIVLLETAVFRGAGGSGGKTATAARKTLLKDGFWGGVGLTGIGLVAARKVQSGGQKMFKINEIIC